MSDHAEATKKVADGMDVASEGELQVGQLPPGFHAAMEGIARKAGIAHVNEDDGDAEQSVRDFVAKVHTETFSTGDCEHRWVP